MMRSNIKKDGMFIRCIEGLIDIILINLGFYLAFMLRFNMNPSPENIKPFAEIIPFISLTSIVFFYVYSTYSMLKKSLAEIIYSIILSIMMIEIVTVAIAFFSRGFAFPRSVFIIAAIIQVILLLTWKLSIWKIQKASYKSKDILVIGSKDETDSIVKKLLSYKDNPDRIKYICNEFNSDIFRLIDDVDEAVICPSLDNETKIKVISYCMGKDKIAYIVPQLFEIALFKSQLEQFDDIPAFKIDNLYLSIEKRAIKRLIDVLIAFVGIIISLPAMVVIAIATKLYDRGPVLFVQERITRGNKIFKLYKFRTMIVDAEKYTGPVLAANRDPRVTPIGRVLRATRLDELPQLFNVLKGDMSIVGPRPERPFFVNQFIKEIPGFKYRVTVKAGVTGLAQVLGKYTTTPEDKLRYDLLYIRNYSLLLDLKIIFQTIKIMFMKENSDGIKEDLSLEDMLTELGIKAYEEMGVTKLD